ncbi:hypothetical protein BGZ50_009503 [Haplosporangium sp. Z 11]|nr:hypothetical protein BGZ50_009503 [Haplosporangium sp. Z 11]
MQNIPGLSFFDGLTRSRASPSASKGGRSSSHSGTSPPETPLRDAAPFASLRGVRSSSSLSHSLGSNTNAEGDQDEASASFNDPLSQSASSSSLPAASFSRRAATVSARSTPGPSPPIPGLPTRRTSGASTTTRPSILSKESIFSMPILGRRPASVSGSSSTTDTSNSTARERSGSVQSNQETEKPTAKDVELMAQGTQAYSMLKRIQEHPIELADIIRLLAIQILPTCASSTEHDTPSRAYFEDHVIIPESNSGESLFVTLSGIRGVLRPASSSITLLGLASGQDFGTIASDASGPTKRSFFDNISKAEGNEGSAAPTAEDELRLVNSSKRPVVIYIESVGSIHALLVNNSIPKPEGDAAPTPIVPLATGLASVKDRSSARRTASSGSSARSVNMSEDKDATPLPKLPRIASDLPLEWDFVLRDLENLVVKLKKNPLPDTDRYANEFQRKYDDVRQRFEAYGTATGVKHRWSDHDLDEVQQWVEAWLCREMYHVIFPQSEHGINSQDYWQDEQLQAKIAALNFLDLTLEHLGFVLEHPEDVAHIARVVREGGVEMQKLVMVRSPSDKMNVILSSHRVVIDALNREPAVQEMLADADQSKEIKADDTIQPNETETQSESIEVEPTTGTKSKSKRFSMPKIPMDGDIPTENSVEPEPRLPRIPMDEGYERPSQALSGVATEDTIPSVSDKEHVPQVQESSEETKNDNADKDVKDGAAEKSVEEDKMESQTAATEQDINPADIALPPSPLDTPSILSPVIPDTAFDATEKDTETPAVSSTSLPPSSAPSKKQYSADVILPLLIFCVVKSNPPMLISNLRYIQRFKVQDHLIGELEYCLTNMTAVVSFLETLDPHALGLADDERVMSDMSDIQAISGKTDPATPLINFQEGFDHTKALGHKVSQDIVGVAEEGIKVISDVVQDGYSKFFGRFLTAADGSPIGKLGSGSSNKAGVLNRGSRPLSAASSLAATIAADAAAVAAASAEEKKKDAAGLISPVGEVSGTSAAIVDATAESALIEKTSPHVSAMEHAARSRVLDFIRESNGPQIHFMACTNSDDLRLSDVKSLLEDYQRIGKLLEQVKRLA